MQFSQMLRLYWDRITACVFALAGVGLLIGGWVGISGTAYVAEEIPYMISGGIGGLLCMVVAATMWISADLRDEWQQLDSIERAQAGQGHLHLGDHDATEDSFDGGRSDDTVDGLYVTPPTNGSGSRKTAPSRESEYLAEDPEVASSATAKPSRTKRTTEPGRSGAARSRTPAQRKQQPLTQARALTSRPRDRD